MKRIKKYLLFNIVLFLLFSSCMTTQKLSKYKTKQYNRTFEIISDSIKITLPLYEISDTAIYQILKIASDGHMSIGTHPFIMRIKPIVLNDSLALYNIYSTDFFSWSNFQEAYGGNVQHYVRQFLGAFYYNKNIIILEDIVRHGDTQKDYKYLITSFFKDSGQKIDIYPRFGKGQVATLFEFVYKNGQFSLYKKDN